MPLEIDKIVDDTFKMLTSTDNTAVTVQIDPMPNLAADYTLTSLLYQNLISNAIKYSFRKPNPHIRVGAEPRENQVTYFVQDNGVEFNMKYYDKLFGVFHRLHKQNEYEGTGVGLAVARKIVLAHNGKIWAESEEGEGTTFYFTLSGKTPSSVPSPHTE